MPVSSSPDPVQQCTDPTDPASRGNHRWRRFLAIGVAIVLVAAVAGPLVWPVPALTDTTDPRSLAGPYGRFVTVDGIDIHYLEAGESSPTVILMHGFGASTFSWEDAFWGLAMGYHTIAYDRPAFGLTERPMPEEWGTAEGPSANPYSLEYQADQVVALMDELGVKHAVLVAHSAGASVAVLAAARHPDRVLGLVLEAPAMHRRPFPDWVAPLLRTPQGRRVGPLFVRSIAEDTKGLLQMAFEDDSKVTEERIAGYRLPLRARDWDRALWEYTIAPLRQEPAEVLGELKTPTLVICGDADELVSPEEAHTVASAIPEARTVVVPDMGHVYHEEDTAGFLSEVYTFLDGIVQSGGCGPKG